MSDSHFTKEPPQNGSRVEIVHGIPPRPYVVKTWINGVLNDERAFASEAEAKQYQADQNRRAM